MANKLQTVVGTKICKVTGHWFNHIEAIIFQIKTNAINRDMSATITCKCCGEVFEHKDASPKAEPAPVPGPVAQDGSVHFVPIDNGPIEGGVPVVLVPFSAYELVNLAETLKTVDGSEQGSQTPLQAIHTGDWTMCLAYRLGKAAEMYAPGYVPNQTRQQMREQAMSLARYLTEKKDDSNK